jgi:hypothetical protein
MRIGHAPQPTAHYKVAAVWRYRMLQFSHRSNERFAAGDRDRRSGCVTRRWIR